MTRIPKYMTLAAVCLLVLTVSASAGICCPFCPAQGQTLSQEINQATLVVYGTLSNPRLTNPGAESEGSTDFTVEKIIKHHKPLDGKQTLTINRYIPVEHKNSNFLSFCDVLQGKLEPYRGIPVKAEADLPRYLEGALEVKDAKVGRRLRFFFNYLDNEDPEISNDALKEFGNSDYKEYKEMAAG